MIFLFAEDPIASIFSKNPEVISTTALYLGIVSLSYGAQGIIELNASAFNALHNPLPAAGLSIIRIFLLYVPLALLGSHLFALRGIFGATAIANILTATFSSTWIWKLIKSQQYTAVSYPKFGSSEPSVSSPPPLNMRKKRGWFYSIFLGRPLFKRTFPILYISANIFPCS